jgi:preprotein translocase subunit SecA
VKAIEAKENVQIQAESVTLASNLAEDSEVTSDKHGMKNGI